MMKVRLIVLGELLKARKKFVFYDEFSASLHGEGSTSQQSKTKNIRASFTRASTLIRKIVFFCILSSSELSKKGKKASSSHEASYFIKFQTFFHSFSREKMQQTGKKLSMKKRMEQREWSHESWKVSEKNEKYANFILSCCFFSVFFCCSLSLAVHVHSPKAAVKKGRGWKTRKLWNENY